MAICIAIAMIFFGFALMILSGSPQPEQPERPKGEVTEYTGPLYNRWGRPL